LAYSREELRTQVEAVLEECGGATVEEFIPGREIACLCYSSGSYIRTLAPV
jgi:hypothetical protein